MVYDYIIVGGGTTGCVIAARLSEDPGLSVLLLEAGQDHVDPVPAELRNPSVAVTAGHNWDWGAIVWDHVLGRMSKEERVRRVFEVATGGPPPEPWDRHAQTTRRRASLVPYPLARVVGGGSAINGGLCLAPREGDLAAWVDAGARGWSLHSVEQFLTILENAEPHKPPLSVNTVPVGGLTSCQDAFFRSCLDRGWAHVDLSDGVSAGVGMIPKATVGGERASSATIYLDAARARPNLTLCSNCLVDRLILVRTSSGLSTTGVDALVEGRAHRFTGGHVVLSAGAIGSPAVLQRSGVGGRRVLEKAGVRQQLHLPGVGTNLQDHPSVSAWGAPMVGACKAGEPVHQVMLQWPSSLSDDGFCDLQIYMLSAVPTRSVAALHELVGSELAAGVSAVLARPQSRGNVRIVSSDPMRPPEIMLNCLDDESDVSRMLEGVRVAWDLLNTPRLRRRIENVIPWTNRIIRSDGLLRRLARTTARTTWHPVGTLRMGDGEDPLAVVDGLGRLRGIRNVTVADASIMPSIPSVPPGLACFVVGERAAASLTAGKACWPS